MREDSAKMRTHADEQPQHMTGALRAQAVPDSEAQMGESRVRGHAQLGAGKCKIQHSRMVPCTGRTANMTRVDYTECALGRREFSGSAGGDLNHQLVLRPEGWHPLK